MIAIPLFYPDFIKLAGEQVLTPTVGSHPLFFFESDNRIIFYKPIGSVLYYLDVNISKLPDDFNLSDLKSKGIPIPKRINLGSIKISQ